MKESSMWLVRIFTLQSLHWSDIQAAQFFYTISSPVYELDATNYATTIISP